MTDQEDKAEEADREAMPKGDTKKNLSEEFTTKKEEEQRLDEPPDGSKLKPNERDDHYSPTLNAQHEKGLEQEDEEEEESNRSETTPTEEMFNKGVTLKEKRGSASSHIQRPTTDSENESKSPEPHQKRQKIPNSDQPNLTQ